MIPGWDVAGTVVAAGSAVSDLNVGDEVYSYNRPAFDMKETHPESAEEKMEVILFFSYFLPLFFPSLFFSFSDRCFCFLCSCPHEKDEWLLRRVRDRRSMESCFETQIILHGTIVWCPTCFAHCLPRIV